MASGPGLAMKMTADTVGISRGITKTEKMLGDLSKSTRQATSAMRGLVAIEIGKMFAGAVSSVAGMVDNIRTTAGEISKLAQVSNASAEEFQRFAVAASTVGVEQEKLADIFKDVNDRVGDFMETGGGPMADFFDNIAPKVGVTAEQFAKLSGPEALQLYVDSLEKAGLSQQQMTFYLEAMASDTTALIPILQNGGAAVDELAARAEGLGQVLSKDQTSAIKQMNKSLGDVYKTFEGIIAQVTGNLAPIITAISEKFLEMVAGFQEFGGGGSGIATAITNGLLEFAKYIASIFDYVIVEFMSFGVTMSEVAGVFDFVANVFTAVAETLRAIFNVFEMVGNALMLGLGKFLEQLGSWVSSDLEEAGKQLATSSSEALKKNAGETADALVNAANAALGDRNFGREEVAAEGPLASLIADAEARLKQQSATAAAEAAAAAPQLPQVVDAEQEYANKLAKLQQDLAESSRKAEEERQKELTSLNEQYAKESEKIEEDRLDALSKVNQKALEVSDIRSGGISQFLALATGREDPSVEAARQQAKSLENIEREIKKLGGTVEILGAA